MPALKGAVMAENDAPQLEDDNLEDRNQAPLPRVPAHTPLPLPPEVAYTRPTLSGQLPKVSPITQAQTQAQLSQGVQGYGLAIMAAITLAVTLLAFVALGQWMDHRWNASGTPWFTIVGLLIGIAGGFYNMIRLLSSTTRKK